MLRCCVIRPDDPQTVFKPKLISQGTLITEPEGHWIILSILVFIDLYAKRNCPELDSVGDIGKVGREGTIFLLSMKIVKEAYPESALHEDFNRRRIKIP